MKLSRTAAFVALLACVAILGGCAGDPAFTSGKVYLADKNYEKAIEQLTIAVKNSPEAWEPHMYLGWAYADLEELEKAHDEWFAALDLAPDEKSTDQVENVIKQYWLKYAKQGEEFNQAAKFERAIELFNQALIIDPRKPDAYINLGYALVMMERFDDAIGTFEQALEYSPDNEILVENLSTTYANKAGKLASLNDYEGALLYFEKVVAVAPDTPDINFNIGMMHYHSKRYRDGIRYFRRHLEGSPEDEEVLYRVFLSHWALGQDFERDGMTEMATEEYTAAIDPLMELVEVNEEEISYHRNLARIYGKLGRDVDAMAELSRVEELMRAEGGE